WLPAVVVVVVAVWRLSERDNAGRTQLPRAAPLAPHRSPPSLPAAAAAPPVQAAAELAARVVMADGVAAQKRPLPRSRPRPPPPAAAPEAAAGAKRKRNEKKWDGILKVAAKRIAASASSAAAAAAAAAPPERSEKRRTRPAEAGGEASSRAAAGAGLSKKRTKKSGTAHDAGRRSAPKSDASVSGTRSDDRTGSNDSDSDSASSDSSGDSDASCSTAGSGRESRRDAELERFPDVLVESAPQKPKKSTSGLPDWLAKPLAIAPDSTRSVSDPELKLSDRMITRCADLGIEELFAEARADFIFCPISLVIARREFRSADGSRAAVAPVSV
ncbi:MAG: hypothetical protein BJ554DRAFT_740, partial [Olpidium bornovanus]